MQVIKWINFVVSAIFFICYFYQFAYVLVPFLIKKSEKETEELKRYAVLISARNEKKVIGYLIDSINSQNYPSELIDVYVVADNCSDGTAQVARDSGAYVWERNDQSRVGKGHALDFLYKNINEKFPDRKYAGYFVFDADNVLDGNYVREMNKVFNQGYRIITSYRNSKNYDSNWISAGYALWFLRESKYINESRMLLGTSCAVSGTGFLVSSEIFKENNGWKFYLLTEDIQFTVHNICKGEKIGYAKNAVLYDEQPIKFSQSWKQRMRWAKGFYQVFAKYGKSLAKGCFSGKGFACFDLLMIIMPAFLLSTVTLLMNIVYAACMVATGGNGAEAIMLTANSLLSMYIMFYILGLVTTITEWNKINTTPLKKILYTFTFPLFQATYIPISLVALFKKVKWEPIDHTQSVAIEQLQQNEKITFIKSVAAADIKTTNGLYSKKD